MNTSMLRKLFLLIFCLAAAFSARAEEKAGTENKISSAGFLRIQRDVQNKPRTLETAIVRYLPQDVGKKPFSVDLIAAVHIADKGYYRQINEEFKKYDVVLYELVAPPGAKIPQGGGKKSPSVVSFVQRGMKDLLELDFQLDAVDYTAANLVHADMSPEQFSRSMAERNESFWTYFSRMMNHALEQQAAGRQNDDAQMFLALFKKNRSVLLKRIMAEQFIDMGGTVSALEGPRGSALITGRNQVALDVLRKQIDAGKRKIAVFYGGAHMPDFDKKLRADFRMRPAETRWLAAWDLKEKPEPPVPPKKSKPKAPQPTPSKEVAPKAARK
jgi:hypothetical protein